MRKCFTGRVGDASFQKALAFIEEGGRATLFANDGAREKVIHFSPERILKLPWDPQGEEAARLPACLRAPREESPRPDAPQDAKPSTREETPDLEEVRRFVRSELEEVIFWRGALFEVLEGPIPVRSPIWSKALEVHASPAALLAGITKATAGSKPANRSQTFPDDPLARADVLAALIAGPTPALTARVILRELAAAWKDAASPHRAAYCLEGLARHHLEWCDEEKAMETLEMALELCPADAKSAERLIGLHVSAGRHREAEAVAEAISRHFQPWKLHDLLARFYKMLGRAPESAVLRRVGAEAMIRTGDLVRGLKELTAIAVVLESRGDKDGARSAYERVLELDPANAGAKRMVQGAKRRDLWTGYLGRWGTLAAAFALAVSWVFWDIAAASALGKVKGSSSSDPREHLELLRTEASHFPVTRQPARLASREAEVYEKSLEEDSKLIRQALDARAAGDIGTAYHVFGTVSKRTLIPALAARAEAGCAEIKKLEAEREERLRHAAKLVQARELEAASCIYIGLLEGQRRAITLSGYSVPVLLDTVPRGAEIEIDRKQEGRTPRWVFLPADPDSVLRLSLSRFQTLEIADPLAEVLRAGSPRLRKALVPEAGWHAGSWGGTVAAGASPDGPLVPILGADGVLRGIAPRARKPVWETPLDAPLAPRGPVAAGPIVVVAAGGGTLAGFAASSGKAAWTLSLGERGGELLLGQVFSGQLAVARGSEVFLVNPQSGLVQRRIDVGFDVRPEGLAIVGDRVFAVDDRGGIARIGLRTGRRDLHREKAVPGPAMLLACGGSLVAVSRSGEAAGIPPDLDGRTWEARVGGEVRAASASSRRVFLASAGGSLVCLDAAAGTPLWKTTLDGEVKSLAGAEASRDAIIATFVRGGRACVNAIGAADAALLWEVEGGPGEEASVAVGERSAAVSSPSLGVLVLPLGTRP